MATQVLVQDLQAQCSTKPWLRSPIAQHISWPIQLPALQESSAAAAGHAWHAPRGSGWHPVRPGPVSVITKSDLNSPAGR